MMYITWEGLIRLSLGKKQTKIWFPDTKGVSYWWWSQCVVGPAAFWKCAFFGTPCMCKISWGEASVWKVYRVLRSSLTDSCWRFQQASEVWVSVARLLDSSPVVFIKPKSPKYGNHCVVQDTGMRFARVLKNKIGRRSSGWLVTWYGAEIPKIIPLQSYSRHWSICCRVNFQNEMGGWRK